MSGDGDLVQIVDAALAEAVRRSGAWLVCRPGCAECCIGPFPITQLDARRLREGLSELTARDPARAARVRGRARESVIRILPDFPGDPATGVLSDEDAAFAEEEPCPALDPASGTCDLYAARPITCRLFGPPVRRPSDAVGVCALCFRGASDEEIAACEVEADFGELESRLLRELETTSGAGGQTIVALALRELP
ncbi:MAG: YkgJ family cysteine cluster protein [Acidobacteriia bacterium]|nr:YkgJ family cysteine cluster protein [Terriglobia bacterium]